MATTYAECFIGIRYRKDEDGTYIGNPMYAMEYGLKKKWLCIFAFSTLIASYGVGCSTRLGGHRNR